MQKLPFLGWENCIQLNNSQIELVVTADVGLRIIHFGFAGDKNVFGTIPSHLGRTSDAEWRNYGGHRFWLAPEQQPRTYYPDNQPVTVENHGSFVRFISPVETTTRTQKTLDVVGPSRSQSDRNPHRAKPESVGGGIGSMGAFGDGSGWNGRIPPSPTRQPPK